ncbi:ABC transporter ATP-binding protein [Hamadaea tsunoensis]|uniref:ABC transporter ATP-binding protein n=1 Tax=Hamadaea tsunoensis TaxID=53368 RepID=UPI000A033096|nr:ABC transporter ATP-binding protein [Hamadaea tsunoensis]
MTNTLAPPAVARGAAVHIAGLVKHYGPVRAVDGVDLVIAPGEVVALLGPNGAGKSTTVDLLLGLITPDAGQVTIFGRTPREAVVAGAVGAMLQSGALRDNLTVAETVGEIAALHHRSGRLAEILAKADVADFARQKCSKLSGGQKQRVRFALALVSEPDLLLLDEPTVGMDVEVRRRFWASMRDYTVGGRTVIFATHYLDEAQEFADRVVFLRHGKVVADGGIAEIRAAASGRTVGVTVPGVTAAELAALPGVDTVDVREDRASLRCHDSDAALRAIFDRYRQAHDVEVTAAGLEEAFLTLTADEEPRP